jgi:hypothetical protein
MTAEPLRVLITGSRVFTERDTIAAALTLVHRENPGRPIIVCHGQATGADSLSGSVARQHPGRLIEEAHPADWRPGGVYNSMAGFDRNQLMVDLGAEVCLAFLQDGERNSGTRDCIRRAKKAKIPVREHWSKPAFDLTKPAAA